MLIALGFLFFALYGLSLLITKSFDEEDIMMLQEMVKRKNDGNGFLSSEKGVKKIHVISHDFYIRSTQLTPLKL